MLLIYILNLIIFLNLELRHQMLFWQVYMLLYDHS